MPATKRRQSRRTAHRPGPGHVRREHGQPRDRTVVCRRFKISFPGITVDLMPASRHPSLSMREADIAVRLSAPEQEDVVGRCIGMMSFRAYASAGYISSPRQPGFRRPLRRPPRHPSVPRSPRAKRGGLVRQRSPAAPRRRCSPAVMRRPSPRRRRAPGSHASRDTAQTRTISSLSYPRRPIRRPPRSGWCFIRTTATRHA